MAANGTLTELETFLPQDGQTKIVDGSKKYEIKISKDGDLPNGNKAWDPFKERKVAHPTTDCDTLTHLLKASLGTGILAMPYAFKSAGMLFSIISTVVVAFVCTHCAYILVKCAHKLYYSTRVTAMTFADVGESAFSNGPVWAKKYARAIRYAIQIGLFAAYFGTCSVYTVIIAANLQDVIEYNTGWSYSIRYWIAALLVPLILLSWIPNLKYLAPVSMIANVLMGTGLGITLYYLVWDLKSVWELPQIGDPLTIPQFFSITIFAMEAIGVVMPLENSMKTPQHFIGICGVLNKGMGGVTLFYILLGFLGYLKYGDQVEGTITLNLEKSDIAAQIVMVFVALAVFCTYGLQYFVCLEIVWEAVKDKFAKNARMGEYVVRSLLTASTVLLAVAVPTIGPFLGLIGALCFSILGLIIPILIEFVVYWDLGFGTGNWIVWKNILLLIFGFFALIAGTYTSLMEIIYPSDIEVPLLQNATSPSLFSNETDFTTLLPTNGTF